MCKISVIVPCYNQARFLPEALDSIIQQTFTNWECIVVNDGSKDNTEDVAKEWSAKDKRIKYLYKENGGVSAARNAAIKSTDCEFILPLDADDKIHKDYIKNGLEVFAKDTSLSLVYAEAEYFGSRKGRWVLPEYDYRALLTRNSIYCSAIFRKADWEMAGGYDETIKELEDWEFWIRFLHGEKRVYKLSKLGFYYRQQENSRNQALLDNDAHYKKTENIIFSKHQKIYEEYFGSIISNLQSIVRLKTENARIKQSIAYKFSTQLVSLASPLRKLIRRHR